MRECTKCRETAETQVRLHLNLDGTGYRKISTGVGFFDHMLEQLALHGRLDLELSCAGDLHVDAHHTVEDCGIVLGDALNEALGTREGIRRYASFFIPMDEALAVCHLDISGRPFLVFRGTLPPGTAGSFDAGLCEEFFRALAVHAAVTLHLEILYGRNLHHMIEALFKAFAHALHNAAAVSGGPVLSTKGIL